MHLTENSELVNAENKKQLFEEWSHYWDLEKKILIEKSPPNLIKTRFLQSHFPRSTLITIIRHPIAVAFATKRFTNKRWQRSRVE
jgi:hypothetical protein